jgi:hypothetical protein
MGAARRALLRSLLRSRIRGCHRTDNTQTEDRPCRTAMNSCHWSVLPTPLKWRTAKDSMHMQRRYRESNHVRVLNFWPRTHRAKLHDTCSGCENVVCMERRTTDVNSDYSIYSKVLILRGRNASLYALQRMLLDLRAT